MKTLAFVIGLCVAAIGAVGVLAPSNLLWIAQHSLTSGAFYLIGAVRVAVGFILILAAPTSRAPRTLRILGFVVVIAGLATIVIGLVGMERARMLVEWWLQQGAGLIRVTGVVIVLVGGCVAYACTPSKRT